MDLKQVRTFIYVAKLRSFSEAARALNIAQPAVSRQVQALEEDLSTTLLMRTPRGAELTEAGAVLAAMGENILAEAEQIRQAVMQTPDRVRGLATLGMPPSLMPLLALPVIERCRQLYPEMTLHVTEGLSIFLDEWLSLGRIDLAILTGCKDDGAFIRRTRLVKEELVLVGASELIGEGPEPVAATALSAFDLIITRGFRQVVDALTGKAGVLLRYALEIDSLSIIEEMLARGKHASILPFGLVHEGGLQSRLSVREITDPPLLRDLVIGANPRRPTTAAMGAVQGVVMQLARELPSAVAEPNGGGWLKAAPDPLGSSSPWADGLDRAAVFPGLVKRQAALGLSNLPA